MSQSTIPDGRVKCGNTAHHGREQAVYHRSTAEVRECFANSGRFARHPDAPVSGPAAQEHVAREVHGVWHSTGPATEQGHWEAECPGSSCPVMSLPVMSTESAVARMRAQIEASEAQRAEQAERERREAASRRYAAWRTIPVYSKQQGWYALEMGGTVHFFRVRRPAKGQYAGRTFVDEQASETYHKMPFHRAAEVLDAIAADPESAALLYASQIDRCSRCNRTLTDEVSRARGMGPDCAKKEW